MATPVPAEPAAMTDAQLREAVYRVNHNLIDDTIGPWLMRSFNGQSVNDPRLPRAMPTSPRMHILLGFASAHDAANLAAIGLQLHSPSGRTSTTTPHGGVGGQTSYERLGQKTQTPFNDLRQLHTALEPHRQRAGSSALDVTAQDHGQQLIWAVDIRGGGS
jgi:hypothetical protein